MQYTCILVLYTVRTCTRTVLVQVYPYTPWIYTVGVSARIQNIPQLYRYVKPQIRWCTVHLIYSKGNKSCTFMHTHGKWDKTCTYRYRYMGRCCDSFSNQCLCSMVQRNTRTCGMYTNVPFIYITSVKELPEMKPTLLVATILDTKISNKDINMPPCWSSILLWKINNRKNI